MLGVSDAPCLSRRVSGMKPPPQLLYLAFLALFCAGCGNLHIGSQAAYRRATFKTSYQETKEKLGEMRPGVKWQGKWIQPRGTEKLAGEYYVLSILEGGSDWHKAPHRTVIHVIRIDDSSCRVEIHSWARNMVFPSHRMWLKEWERWRELKRLLGPI